MSEHLQFNIKNISLYFKQKCNCISTSTTFMNTTVIYHSYKQNNILNNNVPNKLFQHILYSMTRSRFLVEVFSNIYRLENLKAWKRRKQFLFVLITSLFF